MDILVTIKRLVFRRQIIWTSHADTQMVEDDLTREEIIESILSARHLRSKRSTSEGRVGRREKVHIIVGKTFAGVPVYTKGVIRRERESAAFYVVISAKRNRLVE